MWNSSDTFTACFVWPTVNNTGDLEPFNGLYFSLQSHLFQSCSILTRIQMPFPCSQRTHLSDSKFIAGDYCLLQNFGGLGVPYTFKTVMACCMTTAEANRKSVFDETQIHPVKYLNPSLQATNQREWSFKTENSAVLLNCDEYINSSNVPLTRVLE